MRVGFVVSAESRPVYEELISLLNINGELYNPERAYDALVLDGDRLPNLVGPLPSLVIQYGASGHGTGSNNERFQLFQVADSLGESASAWLNDGRDPGVAGRPVLDEMLDDLKRKLRSATLLAEVAPHPWGHPYIAAFSHDIDVLSVRELPVGRTLFGFYHRALIRNAGRLVGRRIALTQYLRSVTDAAVATLGRLGAPEDCWARSMRDMESLESRLGIRSTSFFIPGAGIPGVGLSGGHAPQNRSAHYDLRQNAHLLKRLMDTGHEVGVHGLDAWHDGQSAREERSALQTLTKQSEVGVRMHWLYFRPEVSWQALDQGGFVYDSTFGYNEVVGFRAGTLMPYQPVGTTGLWEVPLLIQDGALLDESYQFLRQEEVASVCAPIFAQGRKYGGIVTVLWHNHSFESPRFWGPSYEALASAIIADDAYIVPTIEALKWHQQRRSVRIEDVVVQDDSIEIRLSGDVRSIQPRLILRLHVPGAAVARSASVIRREHDRVDLRVDDSRIRVELAKGQELCRR